MTSTNTPLPSSADAAEAGCSKLPPKPPLPNSDTEPELYVALSGKQKPRPLAWLWRRRPAVKALSIATSQPSTVARGADSWMSALRACRARRSAPPANEPETATSGHGAITSILTTATRGGLNPTGSGYWPKSVPPWLSSRTCQPGLPLGISALSEIAYQDWVTQCKTRSSSLRTAWAARINASGYLCWRPPASSQADHGGPNQRDSSGAMQLTSEAANWPTAASRDEKGPNGEEHRQSRERPHDDQLQNVVQKWATANACERGPETADSKATRPNTGAIDLHTQASQWLTASATDAERRGTVNNGQLNGQATDFPSTAQAETTGPLGRLLRTLDLIYSRHCATLVETALNWLSGGDCDQWLRAGIAPNDDATRRYLRNLLLDRMTQRRLNPSFQWWLMGWPSPAMLLSATHRCCGSAATAWTAWRRQLQSLLSCVMQGKDGE